LNAPGDSIVATGVPPHVSILEQMKTLAENVSDVVPALHKVASDVIRGVVEEIENRALSAGTVTRDGMETLILTCLEKSGLSQLARRLDNSVTLEPDQMVSSVISQVPNLHVWGGRFNLIPQDFSFPNGCSMIAWKYWMCGDHEKQYPPLRSLTKKDMPNKNMKKRLSDFQFLMSSIENRVKEMNKWIPHPSVEQANEMFEIAKDILDTEEISTKGRRRRGEQTKWNTMVNKVRKKQKSV
jgi:hypothetical protein